MENTGALLCLAVIDEEVDLLLDYTPNILKH